MIIIFLTSFLLLIVLSYFFEIIPQLFLINVIFIGFINSKSITIRLFVLLIGFLSDLFFFSNYYIYTLYYFLVYLIIHHALKTYFILEYHNLTVFLIIFITLQKVFFFFIYYALLIENLLPNVFPDFFIEMFFTIAVGLIYLKIFKKRIEVKDEF